MTKPDCITSNLGRTTGNKHGTNQSACINVRRNSQIEPIGRKLQISHGLQWNIDPGPICKQRSRRPYDRLLITDKLSLNDGGNVGDIGCITIAIRIQSIVARWPNRLKAENPAIRTTTKIRPDLKNASVLLRKTANFLAPLCVQAKCTTQPAQPTSNEDDPQKHSGRNKKNGVLFS